MNRPDYFTDRTLNPFITAAGDTPSRTMVLPHGRVTLVDAADYDRLARWKWRVGKNGYVCRNTRSAGIYLHRAIMGAGQGAVVDHINGDKLDNRRCNLRLCSVAQNGSNSKKLRASGRPLTSRYKGVSASGRERQPWAVRMRHGDKYLFLGRFTTQEEAARAYDDAARTYRGEFARVNFAAVGEQCALRADVPEVRHASV